MRAAFTGDFGAILPALAAALLVASAAANAAEPAAVLTLVPLSAMPPRPGGRYLDAWDCPRFHELAVAPVGEPGQRGK